MVKGRLVAIEDHDRLGVDEGGILGLVLTEDLRQLGMVELVTLVVRPKNFIPSLAHLLNGDGSKLKNRVSLRVNVLLQVLWGHLHTLMRRLLVRSRP